MAVELTIPVGTMTSTAELVAQAVQLATEQDDVRIRIKALHASMQSTRPDLSGVDYGVIALSDRTYAETFCFGA